MLPNVLPSKALSRYISIITLVLFSMITPQRSLAYCSPTFANGCGSWHATSITISNLNWTLASCTTWDYTSTQINLTQASTYTMNVSETQYCGATVWIDTNNNGTFDANELFYSGYYGGTAAYTYTFPITVTSAPGNYRMRVIDGWGSDGVSVGANGYGPCGSYQYGNYEDFTVHVVAPPPCSGTPNPAVLTATSGMLCPGSTTSIIASGYSFNPGIVLQLQYSMDGISWSNYGPGGYINPVTGVTTTIPITQSQMTYYRVIDSCTYTGLYSISNVIQIGVELNCPCANPANLYNSGCSLGGNFEGFVLLGITGECGSSINYQNTGATCTGSGYHNFTGTYPILKVYPGHSYSWNAEPGYANSGAVGVWADWSPFNNPDGNFGGIASGEYIGGLIVPATGSYTNYVVNPGSCINLGSANSGICIPANIPPGLYRMRVRFATGVSISNIDPCATYTAGEVLDFLIEVCPPPANNVATATPNPVCTGQCLYLSTPTYNGPSGTTSYYWTGPAGFTSTQENPVICNIAQFQQGTYLSNVLVNDVMTCASSAVVVTVATTPVPAISPAGPITLCAPGTQLLSGNTGSYHYQWVLNGVAITGATTQAYTASVSGTYQLVDSVLSDACWGTSASPVIITVNPAPTVGFALTGNNPICIGQCTTILFTGTPNSIVTYAVNGNNQTVTLDNSGGYLLTVCPTATTVYTLVNITNPVTGCSNGASGIITINVNPLPTAGITGITPTTICQGACAVFTITGTPNATGSYILTPGGAAPFTLSPTGVATFTICPTTTTTIALGTLTNPATGCSATPVSTATLTVSPLPTATISGPTTVCIGSCVTVTFTGTPGAIVTYTQTGIAGTLNSPPIGITGTATITVCPTVTTTISLLSINNPATGCNQTISGSLTITPNVLPTATVAVTGANPICSGSCTTLTFTGTPNATVAYTVSTGGTGTKVLSAGGTGTVSVCPTATAVYSVTSVTDAVTGCVGNPASSATVTVNPLPTAALTGAASICTGLCTTMTITGTPNSVATYTWAPGGTNTQVTIPASGTYTFQVCPTVTTVYAVTQASLAATGCSQTLNSTQTVTVGQAPNITITGGTTVCSGSCTPLVIHGGPGSAGDQVTYNDGANHTVTLTGNPGSYTITACPAVTTTYSLVSVTTSVGCTFNISGSTVVTVTPSPTAIATPQGSTEICQGGVVVLNGFAGVGYTYQWWDAVAGIAIPGATNATYITGTAGSYYIVESLGSCSATSNTVTVTVDNVQATITSNTPTSFCIGGSVVLHAPTGAGYLYQWLQDGSAIPGATTSSYTTSTAGSYQVAVTNSIGCGNTSAVTVVSVHPMPTANLTTTGALSFCPGDSVVITTDTGTGYTYQWSHPSGVIAGATNVSYTTYTSDTIAVTVTSAYGCITNSNPLDSVRTTRNASPTAGITLSGPSTVCFNQSVNLTATTDIGTAFQWYYDGIVIPGANNMVYNVFVTGDYSVVISSPAGCSATSSNTEYVLVEPQPFVTTGNPVVFCQGNNAQLSVNTGNVAGSPAFTYQWSLNGYGLVGATNPTYDAQYSGTYVCYVTIPNNCTDTSTTIQLTVNPLPVPVISGNNFTLTTGSFASYQWYLNNQPVGNSQTINITGNGQYTVEVTDANGCVGVSIPYVVSAPNGLGVNTITKDDVKIYPNPASATVHIQAPVKVNVIISGVDGKEVLKADDAKDINISNLPDAVYTISVYTLEGERIKMEKLVKSGY